MAGVYWCVCTIEVSPQPLLSAGTPMNIKEVARLAKVSTATVSRTINGSDKVTAETAARVRLAIETLKFYPNTNARALGSGRSSLYGLIISDITNPFFPELVKSFEDVAVQCGQEVLVANTNYDKHRMELCVTRMLQRKVDGVAIMTSEIEEHLVDELSSRRIPLVFMDTATPQRGISNISIDYAAGIDAAVEHLIALSHRAIGFISGPMELTSSVARRNAFLSSMQRRGLNPAHELIEEGNHRMDGGHEAMARLLSKDIRPTAVMASNDMTAIGAMGAIFERGLKIPRDISVVGFDDIEISAFTQPALTTVRLSRTEIARVAFRALHDVPNAATVRGQEYSIRPVLAERKSTGPVLD
jgi:DNA-binding LacI/PurR family transcriptional regulator